MKLAFLSEKCLNIFDLQLRSGLDRAEPDLFFNYLIEAEDPALPNRKEFIEHFYYLINFLNEVEKVMSRTGIRLLKIPLFERGCPQGGGLLAIHWFLDF